MPQFDFTFYNSQVFWFFICFAILYLASAFVILPRIRDIIANRKKVVDADKISAKKLEIQVANLQGQTEKLQRDASDNYENKMDEISRQAARDRDLALANLKKDLEEKTKNSRQELKALLEKSESQATSAIQALVQNVKTKILG